MTRVYLPIYIALLALFIPLSQGVDQPGQHACHSSRETIGEGQEECNGVYVVPRKLCSRCKIKDWDDDNGNYFHCRSIMNVMENGCLDEIGKYVKKNPCDKKRAADYETIKDVTNPGYNLSMEHLDYFTFGLCENCCDCIPNGSQASEYKTRKKLRTLFKEDRGNCPAHARSEICTIWPDVRGIARSKSAAKKIPDSRPPICPQLHEWFNDIQAQGGWKYKAEVSISDDMRIFLSELPQALSCKGKKIWKRCVNLENTQGRL